MAVYNGEKYLAAQIRSIIPQLGIGDELVISDDGSEDNTGSIIGEIDDKRIKYFVNEKRNGPVSNFENALKKASGSYIFLADQDDIWHRDKIDIMQKSLYDYDMAICDCEVVNEELEKIYPSFFHINHSGKGLLRNLFKNSYIGCCMGFRREVLDKSLPFPENIPMHDAWIGLVGEMHYKVKFIDRSLVKYRRHRENISAITNSNNNGLAKKISNRFKYVKHLIARA